jgi:hypothetical protein
MTVDYSKTRSSKPQPALPDTGTCGPEQRERKLMRWLTASVAAVALFGAGYALDQNAKAKSDIEYSQQLGNNLHQPMFGDTIKAVDSPWYTVEGGSFQITEDGTRVRWNPEYSDVGLNGGGRLSDANYYGQLKEGQGFTGVDIVVVAGSYMEDGGKEMPYIGILYEDFIRNLADDNPLKAWLEKQGLKPGDVVFVALGKTNAIIAVEPTGDPAYRRNEKAVR